MRDLLERRKVRVLVFNDCSVGAGNAAHPQAPAWFRLAEDADGLAGLAWHPKISFYTSAILGVPRNLLGLLRTNLPAIQSDEISWTGFEHVGNPSLRLVSLSLRMTLGQDFTDYTPQTSARSSDVHIITTPLA